jgi:2-polyprenyl-3-methyl-5-hydroxy-6-metoxy-1,4-benzoquinol methylase
MSISRLVSDQLDGNRFLRKLYRLNFAKFIESHLVFQQLRVCSPKFRTLCDVGCGDGIFAREVVRRGFTVCALDLDVNRLVRAQSMTDSSGYISYICASSDALPFRNGSFDLITAISTIEHFKNDQGALAEIYKTLDYGGSLILTLALRLG